MNTTGFVRYSIKRSKVPNAIETPASPTMMNMNAKPRPGIQLSSAVANCNCDRELLRNACTAIQNAQKLAVIKNSAKLIAFSDVNDGSGKIDGPASRTKAGMRINCEPKASSIQFRGVMNCLVENRQRGKTS